MNAPLKFKSNILPYASEMYGVYQPLLGWISTRAVNRFSSNRPPVSIETFLPSIQTQITKPFLLEGPNVNHDLISLGYDFKIDIGQLNKYSPVNTEMIYKSFLLTRLKDEFLVQDMDKPETYKALFNTDHLKKILQLVTSDIRTYLGKDENRKININKPENVLNLTNILSRESKIACALVALQTNDQFDSIKNIFVKKNPFLDVSKYKALFQMVNPEPLDNLNIKDINSQISLSPIGIVHLYRQYYYEFDSFLGPPVQHVWVSPGGTVELIEVQTRKTTIERTQEQTFDNVQKSELATDIKDEISDSVRKENETNTKFGVSVSAGGGISTPIYTADVKTTTTYELDKSSKEAQEHTHKQNREQSNKLSSEIRKNFKSTFKTVTEVTDTSSKRYVLANNTTELVNYELRRKMRQVGVQLQDLGESLCWQSYIDNPGDQLGIAKLVHIASPAALDNLSSPPVQSPPAPINADYITDPPLFFPFSFSEFGSQEGLELGSQEYTPPIGWELDPSQNIWWEFCNGNVLTISITYTTNKPNTPYKITFHFKAHEASNFEWRTPIVVKVHFGLKPSDTMIQDIEKANDDVRKKYDADVQNKVKEAFYNAAKDRINIASNITPRSSIDLREEERIIVYRNLISSLISESLSGISPAKPGVQPPVESEIRHLLSELINSIFDVDSMLYFVAPEWWQPRKLRYAYGSSSDGKFTVVTKSDDHVSPQDLGFSNNSQDISDFDRQNVIGWGGLDAHRPDNYFITGDSHPAKLGSSLGWVLQLDGDNLRNAFLNAPWVKAVLPIREGMEVAAINWLSQLHIEGSTGLSNCYAGTTEEIAKISDYLTSHASEFDPALRIKFKNASCAVTIFDALLYLCLRIKEKMSFKMQTKKATTKDPIDPSKDIEISFLATEKVYEYGSDPLQGGFRANSDPSDAQNDPLSPNYNPFKIFDQWIEVLPTDQIAAVQVTYDPKTGMQI